MHGRVVVDADAHFLQPARADAGLCGDAATDLGAYVPLDISESALMDAAIRVRADYPKLRVQPVLGDFEHLAPLPDDLGLCERRDPDAAALEALCEQLRFGPLTRRRLLAT